MTLDDANPKGAVQATATLAVDVRSEWEQMLQRSRHRSTGGWTSSDFVVALASRCTARVWRNW